MFRQGSTRSLARMAPCLDSTALGAPHHSVSGIDSCSKRCAALLISLRHSASHQRQRQRQESRAAGGRKGGRKGGRAAEQRKRAAAAAVPFAGGAQVGADLEPSWIDECDTPRLLLRSPSMASLRRCCCCSMAQSHGAIDDCDTPRLLLRSPHVASLRRCCCCEGATEERECSGTQLRIAPARSARALSAAPTFVD